MATKFITPSWRMPKNSNQSKASNYSLDFAGLATIEYATPVDLGVVSTFSFWMNIDVGTTGALFGNTALGTFEYVVYYSGSAFFFKIAGAYADFPNAAAAISTGQWHHVAFVRPSENEVKCYIDSVLTDTITSWTGTPGSNPIKFDLIGSRPGGGLAYSGKIGQIAGFDYALTDSAVTALYNDGIPANPLAVTKPPIAFYDLGQGSAYAEGSAGIVEPNLAAATGSTVFEFDSSSNQYINYGNILDQSGTDPFSISGWFYLNSTKSNTIVSKMNSSFVGYQLYVNAANKLKFLLQGTGNLSATGNTVLSLNNWYNVVLTYDGSGTTGGINLFLNGAIETFTGLGSNSGGVSNSENFEIGARTGAVDEMDGLISNVQVWNTELGTSDVTTLYNNGTPLQSNIPQSGSLKAWYKLGLDTSNWNGSDWVIGEAQANYSSALSFDGVADYIELDSLINLGTVHTISWWEKSDGLDREDFIANPSSTSTINGPKPSVLFYKAANVSSYMLNGNAQPLNVNLNDDKWHNISIVRNGASLDFYIDGLPQVIGLNALVGTEEFEFNSIMHPTAVGRYSKGTISNLAVFTTALDLAAVQALYNNGTPQTSPSSSPTGWWKLNNTTTGIQDSAGSNNGTNNGATVKNIQVSTLNGISSGMDTTNLVPSNLIKSIPYSGYSMDFDAASDDYIDVGTDSSLNVFDGDFSISLWFNHTNAAGSADAFLEFGTFTNRVAMTLGFTSNTGVGFAFGNPSIIPWYYNAGSGFNDGNWHNMIATRTGTTYKIFVDGVDLSYSTGTFNTAGVNRIGTTDYNTFYDGKLSNVAIFDKALSEDEILRVYNGGSPGDLANLGPTSWWSLGADSYFNGSNWICPDIGANTNNGTSDSMGADALVGNGPNSLANGTSTNLDLASDLIGEAPGSTGNAISINMNSLARTGSTP